MPTALTVSEARANLNRIIDAAADSHEPILILGKRANAVLVSESHWNAIQETVHLLCIPQMRLSIQQGMKMPVNKCSRKLDW